MKLLGVDLSIKHINIFISGKRYTVTFRMNLLKGIYDVKVFGNDTDEKVEVGGAYPPLKEILHEYRQIYIPRFFKNITKRLQ